MTPYYDDGQVTIFHGDCREVLPLLSADLVVTDPPYAVEGAILNPNRKTNGRSHNTWHETPEWDGEIDPEWCRLVCSVAPTVAWFGNWKRRLIVEAAMTHPIRCEIVWSKDTHVGPPCPAAMRDERIWLFSDSGIQPRHFETTVWDEPIIPTWAHRHHKNEKPLGLMKRLVRWLSDEGQAVLDPFCGSGTTLVAAKQLGRRAIGVEINERYCEIAANRLRQRVLFGAPELEPVG